MADIYAGAKTRTQKEGASDLPLDEQDLRRGWVSNPVMERESGRGLTGACRKVGRTKVVRALVTKRLAN